jgi:hypothetical protein
MSTLIVFGLIVLAWWILTSLWDPHTDCWWCGGSPKRRKKKSGGGKSKGFHFCLVCNSTGRRRKFWSVVLGRGLGRL